MKKVIFAVLAASTLALFSCKKDRTCECTIYGQSIDTTFTKTTKKDAKSKCDAISAQLTLFGGSCKLK